MKDFLTTYYQDQKSFKNKPRIREKLQMGFKSIMQTDRSVSKEV